MNKNDGYHILETAKYLFDHEHSQQTFTQFVEDVEEAYQHLGLIETEEMVTVTIPRGLVSEPPDK